MSGKHSNQDSGNNIPEDKIVATADVVQNGQDPIKLYAENGVLMRRVKRGKMGQAKSVNFINGNRQLQYYTLGYSSIISSRQKIGLLKL